LTLTTKEAVEKNHDIHGYPAVLSYRHETKLGNQMPILKTSKTSPSKNFWRIF